MRRKGSRMSMDRFERLRRNDPMQDQASNVFTPKPLEKVNSGGSLDSVDLSKQNSLDSPTPEKDGGMMEMLENMKNANMSRKHSVIQEEEESPVSDKSSKRDEGIGGSFDQQSEISDSSLNSKCGNGVNGGGGGFGGGGGVGPNPSGVIHSVEEERMSQLDGSINRTDSLDENAEIALDPTKLADGYPTVGADGAPDSPFNKKPGAIKKVSFLWGSEGESDGEHKEPISETYHYEGAKKSKWNLFRK